MSDLRERFDRAFGGSDKKEIAGHFAVVTEGVTYKGVEMGAAQREVSVEQDITCYGTYNRDVANQLLDTLKDEGKEALLLEWN